MFSGRVFFQPNIFFISSTTKLCSSISLFATKNIGFVLLSFNSQLATNFLSFFSGILSVLFQINSVAKSNIC
jgi:hypothetical protein